MAFISGPSFAKELVENQPTAVCAASTDKELCEKVQHIFLHRDLRVYLTYDVIAVEVGGGDCYFVCLFVAYLLLLLFQSSEECHCYSCWYSKWNGFGIEFVGNVNYSRLHWLCFLHTLNRFLQVLKR